MNRRTYLATTTGLLAAAAGCTSTSSGQPESTTAQSLSAADVEFPDGYTETAVEDWEAAKQAHRDALGDQSYTARSEGDSFDYGSGKSTAKVEPGDEEVYVSLSRDLNAYSSDDENHQDRYIYYTDAEYMKTVSNGGSPRYHVSDTSGFEGQRYRVPWEYLTQFQFTFTQARTNAGEPRLHFTSDQLIESAADRIGDQWGDTRSAELVTTVDGLVRESRFRIGKVGETERFLRNSVTIEAVGETTVEKPGWIEEAKSSAST